MSDLAPVFMGSVNRWECDENDHLNVRFFAQKMFQTLQSGLLEAGLAPADAGAIGDRIRSVHMRYIAEARIAAPLTGCFGVVGSGSTTHHVVTELRHTTTGNLMASYLFEIEHLLPPGPETIGKPEGAGGRGLPERCSDYIRLSLDDARQRGFSVIGQGVIQPEECDASGRLLFFQYIGRTSDSIPNLWAKLEGASSRGEGMLGGAVLEYRLDRQASLNLGDRFIIMSGFRSLAGKTKHLVHLLFDASTGNCVTASEAIAINMDLVARKAVTIPDHEREAMSQMLIGEP